MSLGLRASSLYLLSSRISSLDSIIFPISPCEPILCYQDSNFKRRASEISSPLRPLPPKRNWENLTSECGTGLYEWSFSNKNDWMSALRPLFGKHIDTALSCPSVSGTLLFHKSSTRRHVNFCPLPFLPNPSSGVGHKPGLLPGLWGTSFMEFCGWDLFLKHADKNSYIISWEIDCRSIPSK